MLKCKLKIQGLKGRCQNVIWVFSRSESESCTSFQIRLLLLLLIAAEVHAVFELLAALLTTIRCGLLPRNE